jgi:ribose 1,5-bisphosphokinase PhnN
VVRLDGAGDRLDELVLTGDVRDSLAAVMAAARGETGAGFFLVGPFGSGKSHFLAALAQLFDTSRATAQVPARWDAELRQAVADARRALIVRVPLIEHRAQAPLEDVVWRRAWGALGEGLPAPAAGADRVSAWRALLAAARSASHPGLVILVDELSEFLRAKQGPPLTEDLRFVQFLGEWAIAHPAIVVAALQEDLDEIANVSERELARIRDRYPRTLSLSVRHVEDLVRGRLVRVRPGAEHWIERAYRELASAFPGWEVTAEGFARCYPVHPAALELLGSLRFLLSQQRGAVDFICRQLRADPARDYLDLVTPGRRASGSR